MGCELSTTVIEGERPQKAKGMAVDSRDCGVTVGRR